MLTTSRPIRALFILIGLWTLGRTWVLWPNALAIPILHVLAREPQQRQVVDDVKLIPSSLRVTPAKARERIHPAQPHSFGLRPPDQVRSHTDDLMINPPAQSVVAATVQPMPWSAASINPLPQHPSHHSPHLTLSAWALVRGSGVPALSAAGGLGAAGELGGSQAGARLNYWLGSGHLIGLTGRITTPLADRQGKEVAAGLVLQPFHKLPLQIIAERRIALDSGGRNDFELIAAGGIYDHPLGHRLTLSAYAEGGVVGMSRRDLFVDGAAEIEQPLWQREKARITLGLGTWGAAQPTVSRLDIGPEAALHARIGPASLKFTASYRARIAGEARPNSGPVLSLGTDF